MWEQMRSNFPSKNQSYEKHSHCLRGKLSMSGTCGQCPQDTRDITTKQKKLKLKFSMSAITLRANAQKNHLCVKHATECDGCAIGSALPFHLMYKCASAGDRRGGYTQLTCVGDISCRCFFFGSLLGYVKLHWPRVSRPRRRRHFLKINGSGNLVATQPEQGVHVLG